MADSWEELLDNEVLEKSLEQLKVSRTNNPSPNSSSAATSSPREPVMPKILKRLPNGNQSAFNNISLRTPASCQNQQRKKDYDLNSFVNSQPFVPRGQQVTLEDGANQLTMPAPSIKILKREVKQPSQEEQLERSRLASKQASYQERAANNAEARERILGSACDSVSPDLPIVSPSTTTQQPINSNNTTNNGSNKSRTSNGPSSSPAIVRDERSEMPTVRQPIAPDGTRGFRR